MAAQPVLDKAIIIKGPTPESKSYFTGLPGTLDELVQKAVKLFPLPPNHSGHLLLDNDAILMPDVLPFLKDREVLTFRWTVNTPRSSLRQPLRSEEMARHAGSSGGSSSSHGDSVNGSGGSAGSRTSRNVRWDSSVLKTATQERDRETGATNGRPVTDSNKATVARPNTTTARPYRYSAAARAEHSRRVLNEQEQLRHADAKKSSAEGTSNTDDMETSSQRKEAKEHATAGNGDASIVPCDAADTHQEPNVNSSSPTIDASRDVEMTAPPDQNASYDEQQNSSPVASPTRNIRSAQKSNNGWMTPLGSDSKSESDSHPVEKVEKEQRSPFATEKAEIVAQETLKAFAQDTPATVTSVLETSAQLTKKERIHSTYQRMSSVIDALRSHPSNRYFHGLKQGNDVEGPNWNVYLQRTGRTFVDFDSIAIKLQSRQYGQEDPFVGFAADLGQMWSNTRAFFGPQSPEAQCADFLEKFSRMITVEWRKERDANGRQQDGESDVTHTKEQAMARAAKLMKSMTYGSARNTTSVTAKNKNDLARVVASRPDRRTDVFAPTQQHSKPREQSNSPRSTKTQPAMEPVASNLAAHDKLGELNFTPRTHAFLAGMFAKKPSTAQPTSASSDMMAKLQQQFGPISSVNGRHVSLRREHGTPKSRGVKRSAPSPSHATEFSHKKLQVQREAEVEEMPAAAEPVAAATKAAPLSVPVVTVTADEAQQPVAEISLNARADQDDAPIAEESAVGIAMDDAASVIPVEGNGSEATNASAEREAMVKSPRRSGRQSAPTARALQSKSQSPASSKRGSPSAASPVAKAAAAKRAEAQQELTTPQRMVTRRLAAATTSSGGVRTRRAATAV